MTTDEMLTAISVAILLFVAMANWNTSSLITLLAIIIVLFAWYFRSKSK